MKSNLISVIIPAFNESDNILKTIGIISKILNKYEDFERYEIIVVDDFSSDDTYQKVLELNNENINVIRLNYNHGSFTAIRVGISFAKGDAVTFIAADGQDDPEIIPKLIKKWKKGFKVVWAIRESRTNEKLRISIPAKIFYFLMRLVIRKNFDSNFLDRADFCLLDKIVCKTLNKFNNRNIHLFYLIAWLGFSYEKVSYKRFERTIGRSKWTFFKRLKLAINTILGIWKNFEKHSSSTLYTIEKSSLILNSKK